MRAAVHGGWMMRESCVYVRTVLRASFRVRFESEYCLHGITLEITLIEATKASL